MLNIPEEIKELFRADNIRDTTRKKMEINFFDKGIEVLYPYETLYPEESLFPEDLGTPWLSIKNDRLVSESFKLTESICSEEELTFGACEAAQVEFICADVEEDMSSKEFLVTIEVGGYVMTMGTYVVSSIERQADRRLRKITGYDKMKFFDMDVAVWYNDFFSDGQGHTIREFRESLCEYIGIEQERVMLVNDSMTIEQTLNPEQISGRDVLRAICEINGVFGHFERTGVLKYITIKNTGLYPSETLYPLEDLYPSEAQEFMAVGQYRSAVYEEYIVNEIDKLTIRQEEGDIGAIVGTGNNGYVIEGNFLVYGKSSEELNAIATNILDNIGGRFYRPHKTVATGLPYVEVGDGLLVKTSDDLIETFVFSRTLSGIQAMKDEYAASGNEYREEVFGINKEIVQLKGKTAVIKKLVDEVSVELSDLAADTEAQFKVTNEQILLRVKKGEVSSEISIESGQVRITGNRLVVDSKNFKLDESGNATFSGAVKGASISGSNIYGGEISVGNFYADDVDMSFGNFYVSNDGEYLRAGDFWVKAGPMGQDSAMGVYQINLSGDMSFDNPWTEGYTLIEMLEDLYNRVNILENSI